MWWLLWSFCSSMELLHSIASLYYLNNLSRSFIPSHSSTECQWPLLSHCCEVDCLPGSTTNWIWLQCVWGHHGVLQHKYEDSAETKGRKAIDARRMWAPLFRERAELLESSKHAVWPQIDYCSRSSLKEWFMKINGSLATVYIAVQACNGEAERIQRYSASLRAKYLAHPIQA